MPILVKVDVTKIPKERIFQGKKGKYADFILIDKPNDFGDDGFVSMSTSKEEREAGVKGEIVGNWRHLGGGGSSSAKGAKKPAPPACKPANKDPDDDIPF